MIPVIVLHFIAFGAVGMLSEYGLASKLTLAVFILLLGRASLGMSPYRKKNESDENRNLGGDLWRFGRFINYRRTLS